MKDGEEKEAALRKENKRFFLLANWKSEVEGAASLFLFFSLFYESSPFNVHIHDSFNGVPCEWE